jgi:hypothetical protein
LNAQNVLVVSSIYKPTRPAASCLLIQTHHPFFLKAQWGLLCASSRHGRCSCSRCSSRARRTSSTGASRMSRRRRPCRPPLSARCSGQGTTSSHQETGSTVWLLHFSEPCVLLLQLSSTLHVLFLPSSSNRWTYDCFIHVIRR